MKSTYLFYLFFISLLLLVGCKKVRKVTDIIVQPTEREKYERNFEEGDSLFRKWNAVYKNSRQDSLQIALPYVEYGTFTSSNYTVLSYNTIIKPGERLVVEMDKLPDSSKVFIDLYTAATETNQDPLFEGLISNTRQTILEGGNGLMYKILIQAEMMLESSFVLEIFTEPSYAFPVAGHTSQAIQSFWGAPRDGGSRSHKGVDIFAKRGTPVVAAVDGRVRKTGDYGLGGRQVWLREGLYGNSLYYAHLDSIAVESGKRVKVGDTLGFVGNTGNAKTTAPHLHFGIYRGYSGAVDPLPFIKEAPLLNLIDQMVEAEGSISSSSANVRQGPSTSFDVVVRLTKAEDVTILGKTNDWYHIRLSSGIKGYIHQSLLQEKAALVS